MATPNYCRSDCTNGPWTVDRCDNVFVVADSGNSCESYQTWVDGPNTNQRQPCKQSGTIKKNAKLLTALPQFDYYMQEQIPQTYGVHIWGAKSYCRPVDLSDKVSKCFMDDIGQVGCSKRVTGTCTYVNNEVHGLKNGRISYYEIARQIHFLAYDETFSYAESSVKAAGITQDIYNTCKSSAEGNSLALQACLFDKAELQKDTFMDITKFVCPPSTSLDTSVCRESLKGCVYENFCTYQVRDVCFDPKSPYDSTNNHEDLESCNYSALYCQDFGEEVFDPDLAELKPYWPKHSKALQALKTTYPQIDRSPNMQGMWFEIGLTEINNQNNTSFCAQVDACIPTRDTSNKLICINENDTNADIYTCEQDSAASPCEIDCSLYTAGFPGVCTSHDLPPCDGLTKAECAEESHCTFANEQCVAQEFELIDNIAPGGAFSPQLLGIITEDGALTSSGVAEPKTMIAVLPVDSKKKTFSMLWLLLIIPCGVLALLIAYKVINRLVKYRKMRH